MKNVSLVINTFSNYSDLWRMFFDKLDRHIPDLKRYVFVDKETPDKNSTVFYYNPNDMFRTQFLDCIKKVDEEYCIFISEDYVMYENANMDLIQRYVDILEENKQITFIRFAKGIDFGEPKYKNYDDLYELSHVLPYFYSQTAGLWRTRDLEKIFQNTPDSHIAGLDMSQQFEILASKTCRDLDIRGLFCYHGEPKRGEHHYDSIVFPYITTALVKGKWNTSEYPNELIPLIEEYDIDINKRGEV
jgi:hypothetical protein